MRKQMERVYQYLKQNKSATGLELLRNCGVLSYTKVISELRRELPKQGYTIVGERIKVKSKFNGTASVMEYSLARLKRK